MNIAQQALHTTPNQIKTQLVEQGWVLLRHEHYDVTSFSELMNRLCQRLTYDPARENITRQSQKVDAGTQAMGLHIENGTTPLTPDIIAFFSEKSASRGSQTTLCDGHEVWNNMSDALKQKFAEPMTISRYLPKPIWQKYVATVLNIENAEQVSLQELERFIEMVPGQRISPAHDGGVHYHLNMPMVRHDNLKGVPAFANTLLGPSYNYEKPRFYFADGSEISSDLLVELAERCEAQTSEINWQDGDLVIIDNKRFMHGRREILVPLEQRKLYICMGLGLNPDLHIGSTFGSIGYPGYVSYCASKFALRGATEALAREYAKTSIQFRYFSPRATIMEMNDANVTEMNQALGTKMDDPDFVAQEFYRFLEKDCQSYQVGYPEKIFVKVNQVLPNIVSGSIEKDLDTIYRYADLR